MAGIIRRMPEETLKESKELVLLKNTVKTRYMCGNCFHILKVKYEDGYTIGFVDNFCPRCGRNIRKSPKERAAK